MISKVNRTGGLISTLKFRGKEGIKVEMREYVQAVYSLHGTTGGITCGRCGHYYQPGEGVRYAYAKGETIAECCFEIYFGGEKERLDQNAHSVLDYLLQVFQENPLDSRFNIVRRDLCDAATKWALVAAASLGKAEETLRILNPLEETELRETHGTSSPK